MCVFVFNSAAPCPPTTLVPGVNLFPPLTLPTSSPPACFTNPPIKSIPFWNWKFAVNAIPVFKYNLFNKLAVFKLSKTVTFKAVFSKKLSEKCHHILIDNVRCKCQKCQLKNCQKDETEM